MPPAHELDHFRMADGARLPLWAWTPEGQTPKAVVLALHGFNDYGQAFKEMGPLFQARGLALYAYDQRGFGRAPHAGSWAGTEAMAKDANEIARLLIARHPGQPFYVLGESMGAAVTLAALTRPDAPPVAGAILSAPGLWSRKTMGPFQRGLLWVAAHVLPWMTVSGREMGRMPSDNIEMLRALGRDPHIIKETKVAAVHGLVDLMDAGLESAPLIKAPLLVLYGENDQIIPPKPIQLFIEALPEEAKPSQRLALYPKGWHMLTRDLQAAKVHEDILSWIENPALPLPSGAEIEARERLGRLVIK